MHIAQLPSSQVIKHIIMTGISEAEKLPSNCPRQNERPATIGGNGDNNNKVAFEENESLKNTRFFSLYILYIYNIYLQVETAATLSRPVEKLSSTYHAAAIIIQWRRYLCRYFYVPYFSLYTCHTNVFKYVCMSACVSTCVGVCVLVCVCRRRNTSIII